MHHLKAVRKEQGLTRQELAEKAYITLVTVYNIETRRTKPNRNVRHCIEQALGKSINWKEDQPEEHAHE